MENGKLICIIDIELQPKDYKPNLEELYMIDWEITQPLNMVN